MKWRSTSTRAGRFPRHVAGVAGELLALGRLEPLGDRLGERDAEVGEGLVQRYFDSRGVYRVYKVSLRGGTWNVWRDAPGFAQRFTGKFDYDSTTINVSGEVSRDGVRWVRDFGVTYTKVDAAGS